MYYNKNGPQSSLHLTSPTPVSVSGSSGSHSGRVGSFAPKPVPSVGTSAYKAYQRAVSSGASAPYSSTSDRLFGALPNSSVKFPSIVSGKGASYSPGDVSSGYSGFSGSISAPSLDYLNADLAKHYGMDQATAYNEALSNTSYQRAVKDMQAAGLNPAVLFGNGRVSGADGVYGATPLSASSGAFYYSSSGGSSGGSSRSYSARSRSGKLFSSNTYGMIAGIGALAGAGVAAATGHSVGLGALTGSNLATSAAKVLNGIFR